MGVQATLVNLFSTFGRALVLEGNEITAFQADAAKLGGDGLGAIEVCGSGGKGTARNRLGGGECGCWVSRGRRTVSSSCSPSMRASSSPPSSIACCSHGDTDAGEAWQNRRGSSGRGHRQPKTHRVSSESARGPRGARENEPPYSLSLSLSLSLSPLSIRT